jgi:hypothetical protein
MQSVNIQRVVRIGTDRSPSKPKNEGTVRVRSSRTAPDARVEHSTVDFPALKKALPGAILEAQ